MSILQNSQPTNTIVNLINQPWQKNNTILKILVALGYTAVIVVNYLANALPIGGVTTGEASDNLSNLFTPSGITFSIWGLIYLLLLGYTMYQFGIAQVVTPDIEKSNTSIRRYFIINAFANISWIFAWHYGVIWLSVIMMILLLTTLIKIADIVNKQHLTGKDNFFIRLPFSVYYGWITVATIANFTAFLVSIQWNGFGISETVWTCLILLVGLVIGVQRMNKDRNSAYGLVIVWAYSGILLKHLSTSGFDSKYPSIIGTVLVCLVVLLLFLGRILWKKRLDNN